MLRWLRRERVIRKVNRWMGKGRPEKALELLEEALAKDNRDSTLLVHRAWALVEANRIDEALSAADESLKLYPSDPLLHMIRGEVLLKAKDFAGAEESLKRSLEISGDNIRVEYLLGLACLGRGDFSRAGTLFESSIRYDKQLVQSRLLTMAEHYLLRNSK